MKRKVSDLMDHIPAGDVALDSNTPLSSQRIKELTMMKIQDKTPKRRLGFKLLLIAAVIAAMTMSVFATEALMTYDSWFEDFFSGKEVVADISENQLALLDQSLTDINQSVTSGGYTVTLEQAITDGYVAMLTFRVDAPEGEALDGKRYRFQNIPLELFGDDVDDGDTTLRSGGWYTLEDTDPTDNSVRLLLKININHPEGQNSTLTDNQEKTVTLNTLLVEVGPDVPYTTAAEGEWTFHFTLPDTNLVTQEVEMLSSSVRCTGRRYQGQHVFSVGVEVISFRLRAMTATLVYEEPLTGYWEGITLDPIYVYLKDGSCVEAVFSMSGNKDGRAECVYQFEVPISFRDVDYIEFGGGDRAYMPQ